MTSKRYKKLPKDTKSMLSKDIEKLLSTIKKIVQLNLTNQ